MIERALARMHDPLPLNVCTSIIVTLSGLEVFGALRRLCEQMMAAARRRAAVSGDGRHRQLLVLGAGPAG